MYWCTSVIHKSLNAIFILILFEYLYSCSYIKKKKSTQNELNRIQLLVCQSIWILVMGNTIKNTSKLNWKFNKISKILRLQCYPHYIVETILFSSESSKCSNAHCVKNNPLDTINVWAKISSIILFVSKHMMILFA